MQNLGPHRGYHASEDDLSAYLDGELGPRQAKRLERHLRECGTCQRELAELRATRLLLRGVPQRPVPRSFLLPASVADARRRQRAWNAGFVVLRGAAVAVSLALVVLLSGNALLRRGLLPVPGQAGQTAAATALEEPLAVQSQAAAAEEIMPTPSSAVLAAGAQDEQGVLARARAVLPSATAAMEAASLGENAEAAQELAAAEEPTQVRGSPLDHEGPLTALVQEPRPAQPTADGVDGVFSAAAKVGDSDGLTATPNTYGAVPETGVTLELTPMVTALASTPEPTPTSTPAATEPELDVEPLAAEPLVRPTAGDEAPSGLVAAVAPTVAASAEAGEASSASAQEQVPVVPVATPIDTWQQGFHAATGVLVGVLLMVVAGLVWTDHMRRR
ncbi:MAG: anti-sigma factor [Anaerolineales bacterium]